MTAPAPTVVVVGGGISGLSAARDLVRALPRGHVIVLESSPRWGGKIRTGELAGTPVEEGPDAFVTRTPDAAGLCEELGLGGSLTAPLTTRALVWTRARLLPLPEGLLLGVPYRPLALARSLVLPPAGRARALLGLTMPARRAAPPGADVAVAPTVSARLGGEVVRRLVDPILGGIHAGDTRRQSLAATAPGLFEVLGSSGRPLPGLRALASRSADAGAPFLTVGGGLSRLVDTLVSDLRAAGATLRTEVAASSLVRSTAGWVLYTRAGPLRADGVVVATDAAAAARLLALPAPGAARLLASVRHVSVALVTLALDPHHAGPALGASGFLVPRREGRLMTACTAVTCKWGAMGARGERMFRVSAGRDGDDTAADLDDAELVSRLSAELGEALGLGGPAVPLAHLVSRWPASFPQYDVGHLERVAAIEAALRPLGGLAIAGAALRGIGIPACVAGGRAAAGSVLDHLAGRAAGP